MTLLPRTAKQIDELLARAQAEGRAPTVAGAVVRDGVMVYFGAFGADPETGEIPTRDTQFRIGSITKTLTAVLLMQLRDGGKVALDDLLYRHLSGTPVGSAITLRHLLGHISGLQREPDGLWWERAAGGTIDELLQGLTPDKLAYPPHKTYHYSNLAYGLLGAVLHRVTGLEWGELVRERLLDPLAMTRTGNTEVEPFARGYVVHPWYGTLREEPRTDTGAMAPAGQLWSTPADMAKWAAFLADPDATEGVLSAATLTEMCSPVVVTDLDSWSAGHGLGIELYRQGERVYAGHGGSMPGYLAQLAVHRPSRTGSVVFASAYTLSGVRLGDLNRHILTTVLDAEPATVKAWIPPKGAGSEHELAGTWWWMGRSLEMHFDPGVSVLFARPQGVPGKWVFENEGTDLWRCVSGANDGEVMRVRRDAEGRPSELDIATFVHTRHP